MELHFFHLNPQKFCFDFKVTHFFSRCDIKHHILKPQNKKKVNWLCILSRYSFGEKAYRTQKNSEPLHLYRNVFLETFWCTYSVEYRALKSYFGGVYEKFREQRWPSVHSRGTGQPDFCSVTPECFLEGAYTLFSGFTLPPVASSAWWARLEKKCNLENFFPMQKMDGRVQRMENFHYGGLKMDRYKRDVKPPHPFTLQ